MVTLPYNINITFVESATFDDETRARVENRALTAMEAESCLWHMDESRQTTLSFSTQRSKDRILSGFLAEGFGAISRITISVAANKRLKVTYVVAEPEEVISYRDQCGNLHPDRDAAIDTNFDSDFRRMINKILEGNQSLYHAVPVLVAPKLIREFIETHLDLVRVILGDRDAT